MAKIHQHAKFQAIPSMHSSTNAQKPLRIDRQTADGRKTVTVGRMDQWTYVYVEKRVFQASDGWTVGQPENIMPPAPKGGGIKIRNDIIQKWPYRALNTILPIHTHR